MPGIQLLQPPSSDVLQPSFSLLKLHGSVPRKQSLSHDLYIFPLWQEYQSVIPKGKHYWKDKGNQEVTIQFKLEEAVSKLQG